MVNQMHRVYSNASLTIIDASGGDAQRGLPGVSSLARRPQKCVYIRDTAILELPCGQYDLESSKWATRGWTYQEGYFSTRRLVFTDSQVLFLCNASFAEESVFRLSERRLSERLRPDRHMKRFLHLIQLGTGFRTGGDLIPQLEEYSKRDLTYHRDSLNAFLGVLNYYTHISATFELPILHIFGGLVVLKMPETGDLRVYLDWYHEDPAERRPESPSWSWSGWGGALKFGDEGITLHKRENESCPLPHLEWEVSWKSKDHKTVTIWEFTNEFWSRSDIDKLQLHQQTIYPNRLQITCLVVPIRFQVVSLTEAQRNQETEIYFENELECIKVKRSGLPNESVPVLPLWSGVYIGATPYLDLDLDIRDSIIGLPFVEEGNFETAVGCLLARQLDEGVYERVGAIPAVMDDIRCVPDTGKPPILQNVFLDETGRVLDKVMAPKGELGLLFDGVGQRRTIFLV